MSADSVVGYDVLTGPIPESLRPGEAFVHSRVKVGPDVAGAMLARLAPGYRPISPAYVDRYAHAMTKGEWEYSPKGEICVNHRGELIGGRRVLSAVVQSGREIEADVWHNVQPADVAAVQAHHMHRTPMGPSVD